MDFEIHPQLKKDTHLVAENTSRQILLMNDQRYPWVVVVPKQPNIVEWHDLSENDQASLHKLCVELGYFLKVQFSLDKINTGTLGNIVTQFHIHVIGRKKNDPAWPGPVWGHSTALPYTKDELEARLDILHRFISNN